VARQSHTKLSSLSRRIDSQPRTRPVSARQADERCGALEYRCRLHCIAATTTNPMGRCRETTSDAGACFAHFRQPRGGRAPRRRLERGLSQVGSRVASTSRAGSRLCPYPRGRRVGGGSWGLIVAGPTPMRTIRLGTGAARDGRNGGLASLARLRRAGSGSSPPSGILGADDDSAGCVHPGRDPRAQAGDCSLYESDSAGVLAARHESGDRQPSSRPRNCAGVALAFMPKRNSELR
jgi:hypothetical protein